MKNKSYEEVAVQIIHPYVELRKTLERRGEGRKIVAVILFVATFGLLFLDWMSG